MQHKCNVPNFEEDPTDLVGHRGLVHPVMDAGDVLLFMGGAFLARVTSRPGSLPMRSGVGWAAGATTHGAIAWTNAELSRRVCIVNYLSKDIMIGRL